MTTKEAIALYQSAKSEFDRQTTKAQEALEACGWVWVCKDIGEYSASGRYQDWFVSPEMYASLRLSSHDETPEILTNPTLSGLKILITFCFKNSYAIA